MIYKLKFWFESLEIFINNIYQSFISLIKIILLSKFNVRLPFAEDKECLVLGNGPSLKIALQNHKDFFKDKSLFIVNMFPVSPEYTELKPANLVWLDSGFYIYKSQQEMIEDRPDIQKVINDVIKKTSWQLNLFLPVMAKKTNYLNEITRQNPLIKINYFNYTIVKGFEFIQSYFFRKNLGILPCENVIAASVFLSLNMGFKKIYLFGADHSWMKDISVNEKNQLVLKDRHFYTNEESKDRVVVHPVSSKKINIVTFCISQTKAFRSYYTLNKYATKLDAKIYNATTGSYIDAFERVKID